MSLAIVGAGMVTSVGGDRRACFEALCAGTSGLKPLQYFDAERFQARRAYEIARGDLELPTRRRATALLCRAIGEAVAEAGLTAAELARAPVVVGTGLRELRGIEQWHCDGEPLSVDELHFGGAVRRTLGHTRPVFTVSNACSASLFALGLAEDMIRLGQADTAIVAGCDVLTESMFGLLDRVHLTPPQVLQPFDVGRRGVLMGEGAAAVVLQRRDAPGARPVLGSLRAVGMSCDARHETAPDEDGILRAIRGAQERAGVTPDAIDLIFAHGTGTVLNDKVEAAALGTAFAGVPRRVPLTGIKSMTGHTSGASGLVGVVVALEAMRARRVPPTIGVHAPIPEIAPFQLVCDEPLEVDVSMCQVNAFGFGGVNAVAVVEHA
jgi:3-oxoacyl-[acyl-carrier-protein] synthase II